jgi:hypothetical protein
MPNGAAARSGQVRVGDRVVCIEGMRVDMLSVEEAKILIKGSPNLFLLEPSSPYLCRNSRVFGHPLSQ